MAEDAAEPESSGATGEELATSEPPERAADETDDDRPRSGAATTEAADAYGGLLGAFPYAFRASESWLFRLYVVLGGLAGALTALLFGLSLVALIGSTAGVGGGSFSFVRAFFVFVGLLVIAPMVAPVLFVARRHRRQRPDRRFDATLGGLGFLFLGSLYVAGVISTPAAQQEVPTGSVLEPVVAALYALPRLAGLVPPLLVAGAMVAVARRWA